MTDSNGDKVMTMIVGDKIKDKVREEMREAD